MTEGIIHVDSVFICGRDWKNVDILFPTYADGSQAITMVATEEGFAEPLCKATVNLTAYDEMPAEGCVWIKDWSENDGVLKVLTDLKIVEETGRTAIAGYALAYEAKI